MKRGLLILFCMIGSRLLAQEVVKDTAHNLSAFGPGNVKGQTTEICVFCHIPHSGETTTALWSHKPSEAKYEVPEGSAIQAPVSQPDGVSLQCLGCHDGTIGIGELVKETVPVSGSNVDAVGRLKKGSRGNLGVDLRGHHPVSIAFDAALIQKNNDEGDMTLTIPYSPGWLDGAGKVQCTSCHDPHADRYPAVAPFWKAQEFDEVCFQCHKP